MAVDVQTDRFEEVLATSSQAIAQLREQGPVVVIGVDVDTQHDFATEGGSLFVPAIPEVRLNIKRLSDELDRIVGSVDSHAFDAWEFKENGGPFSSHCVKGTSGWLNIPETQDSRTRFVPMSDGHLQIGEDVRGVGNRELTPERFAEEVDVKGVRGIFEKEVYSLFANPNAEKFVAALVDRITTRLGVTRDKALFAVYGYCTGKYCVDNAAWGLKERGYQVAIVEDATAPLNFSPTDGSPQDGVTETRREAKERGILVVKTEEVLGLVS